MGGARPCSRGHRGGKARDAARTYRQARRYWYSPERPRRCVWRNHRFMTSTDAPCSHRSVDNHEPLAGSAPSARAWIVIEHLGPWGRDALEDSGLNSDCVEHLRTAMDTHGVRTILARPSGARRESAHSERGVSCRRATCGWPPAALGGIGRHGQMTDVSTLLQWDLEALGQGVLPNFGVPMEEAWEFVCTHGKRDVCCATSGRGYALARQAAAPDAHVRECSHLGGHRFAPTCLFLPPGGSTVVSTLLGSTSRQRTVRRVSAGRQLPQPRCPSRRSGGALRPRDARQRPHVPSCRSRWGL